MERLRRAILDLFARARLRAGAAAAARVRGVAALRHRPRPRPRHLQAGRPALGPAAGRARRPHAAGGAHRRAPAQPRGRHAPVLLRQRAAHPARGHDHDARADPDRRRALRPRRARGRPRNACASWSRRCGVPASANLHLDIGHAAIYRALAAGDEPGRRARPRRSSTPCSRRTRRAVLGMHDLLGGQRAEAIALLTRLNGGAEVLERGAQEPAEEPRHRRRRSTSSRGSRARRPRPASR